MNYTKEDLKKAYNSGASNQEMQDAGLEGMMSFDDWFLWAYGKAENLPISDVVGKSEQLVCDHPNECWKFDKSGVDMYCEECAKNE